VIAFVIGDWVRVPLALRVTLIDGQVIYFSSRHAVAKTGHGRRIIGKEEKLIGRVAWVCVLGPGNRKETQWWARSTEGVSTYFRSADVEEVRA